MAWCVSSLLSFSSSPFRRNSSPYHPLSTPPKPSPNRTAPRLLLLPPRLPLRPVERLRIPQRRQRRWRRGRLSTALNGRLVRLSSPSSTGSFHATNADKDSSPRRPAAAADDGRCSGSVNLPPLPLSRQSLPPPFPSSLLLLSLSSPSPSKQHGPSVQRHLFLSLFLSLIVFSGFPPGSVFFFFFFLPLFLFTPVTSSLLSLSLPLPLLLYSIPRSIQSILLFPPLLLSSSAF